MAMKKFWVWIGIVPLAFGVLATTGAFAMRNPLSQRCEIRVSRSGSIVRMDGVVSGPAGSKGQYRFILAKSGPNGDSQIGQGGEYAIGRSGAAVVSSNELNIDSRDRYRAMMLISHETGDTNCSQTSP
ncbi:MAG: hypothetical protein KGM97_06410 [Alphaproteobacteria bacterium]|nr:hypothetical protein [Alphaproteobacteria bacterium]MDE2630607.1 hypothetical protein [Alphaproteobacteria bacterium]